MKYNGDAKRIKAKVVTPEENGSDLFTDEPIKTPWEKEAEQEARAQKDSEQEIDYTPAAETDMDFMTEEEEKTRKKNILIGVIAGLLIAALLIGGFVYHNQSGKVKNANISTTASLSSTVAPGSLESTVPTTRTYVTRQLTVHRDQNGVWRSYAGLEPTVGYTGVVGNDTGWWYVENDVVNFKYNGIGKNDYGEWLIENGKVNLKYSGDYIFNNLKYTIQNGKVVKSERLTTTATTHVTSTTAAATTKTTTTTSSTTTTTTHEHNWVTIYDGDAIVETGIKNGSACICLDCGLIFANAELLESHCYSSEGCNIVRDKEFGGLDSKHILSKEEVGNKDVIVGYTKPDNTYWKCTICGAETRDANEADVGLG